MTTDAAWDRGEGEDGEEIVFVETISTSRKGRALLFASAMFGGLVLGVGVVGAVWAGAKLVGTYGEFQTQRELVQEINPAENEGTFSQAARLDEQDKFASREYWQLRSYYDRLCADVRRRDSARECVEWSNPPRVPEGVEPRDPVLVSR